MHQMKYQNEVMSHNMSRTKKRAFNKTL